MPVEYPPKFVDLQIFIDKPNDQVLVGLVDKRFEEWIDCEVYHMANITELGASPEEIVNDYKAELKINGVI